MHDRPAPPPVPIERHARLDSTNERARQLVERGPGATAFAVLADEQTAGRGTRGRGWTTVPGRSLALSLAVPRPPALRRESRLTLLAALAACRALEAAGAPALAIKWPNDVLRDGRKVAGLLAELAAAPDGSPWIVVGLGANLRLQPGDLPPELARRAGDAGLPPGDGTRDAVASAFVRELQAALAALGTDEDLRRGDEYRRRSWLRGRRVELSVAGRVERVRIAEVTGDGDLRLADGRLLRGEHVQLATPPDGEPSPEPG